jgi:hypothetical protein
LSGSTINLQIQSHPSKRGGYALLIVLLVAGIGSVALVGIAHTVRYETLEMKAKRQAAAARSLNIVNQEKAKARSQKK